MKESRLLPRAVIPAAPDVRALKESRAIGVDMMTSGGKPVSFKEELSRAAKERDDARQEVAQLREKLRLAEEAGRQRDRLSTQVDELTVVASERDQARSENEVLRQQLKQAEEAAGDRDALARQLTDLSRATEERDEVRRDYANLREQFENLKQDQVRLKNESGAGREEGDAQVAQLRDMLAEREAELATTKVSVIGMDDVIETLKQELNSVQTQLHDSREEASVAQRGLALSQKALQETRDALREASAGTSMTKDNLQNLKNECSTLVQQNMLLQGQIDQISRELSGAKAKLAAKGG